MKRIMRASWLAALLGAVTLSSQAHAIPSTLSVQGYLATAAGTAQDGAYTITISLWSAETAGTSLFTQSITNVDVQDGLFDLTIGADILAPLAPDVFKNNNAVWLQIELDTGPGVSANEAPLPRRPLTDTAFAFASHYATSATSAVTANTATTANGLSCSTGCVSIGELDFNPATQAELDAAMVGVVTTTSLASTLNGYITNAGLTSALASYVTSAGLTTSLASYATTAALSSYVSNASLTTTLVDYAKTTTLASYVTSAALTTALAAYATTSSLGSYVTSASLTTTLADYAQTTALASYVTSASLGTTLASYVTNAALTTSLANYVETAALSGYVTTGGLTTTLADYAKTTALASYVTSASLASTLGTYVTTTGLGTALSTYVKSVDLMAALGGYVTTGGLATALSGYVNSTALNTALASYVTTSGLNTKLADYAKTTDIPTSVNGLAGGTITSDTTVTGTLTATGVSATTVTATTIKQGTNNVCHDGGNCPDKDTLAAIAGCQANQIPQWSGTAWRCVAAGGGSVPATPCTGTNEALQWSGTAWVCVNIRNSGLSAGRANGYEVTDDWGDVWDGIQRAPKTWPLAKALCESRGGRLPTVTELWRNRASAGGTGNVGEPDDTSPLWTILESYNANYYHAVQLDTGGLPHYNGDEAKSFRCVWPKHTSVGFDGAYCFGPPGAECRKYDGVYNIDKQSRPPINYLSASRECAFYNARPISLQDYQRLISYEGLPNSTDAEWHHIEDMTWAGGGGHYMSALRWFDSPDPTWAPNYSNNTGESPDTRKHKTVPWGSDSGAYFRCIGEPAGTFGTLQTEPACQGGACYLFQGEGKGRMWADNQDRGPAQFKIAAEDCRLLGALLPNVGEFTALVQSGWENGGATASDKWLWTADQVFWSETYWGWWILQWKGTGKPRWRAQYNQSVDPDLGRYTATVTTGQDPQYYRCVWHETKEASFRTCTAAQVQMWDDTAKAYKCVTRVDGDAAGNTNGGPYTDRWGNVWDILEREQSTYPVARDACVAVGGRLPTATELFRVRYQQPVITGANKELGTLGADSWLWTLNPGYRKDWNVWLRLSDKSGPPFDDAITSEGNIENGQVTPYRCVWPSTTPTAFSGNACYGAPGNPCFETGRLRTDRFDRAPIPYASANWECNFYGGDLADSSEFVEMVHAGAPNAQVGPVDNVWVQDLNWYNTGPGYMLVSCNVWTDAVTVDWQGENGTNQPGRCWTYDIHQFRCVFSDKMR